jgi:hypothetical protein
MAALPSIKDAFSRMSSEGAKMDGTAIMTTVTVDSVKSSDQVTQESKSTEENKGTVGGLLGGLARRAQRKPAGDEKRSTFMTSTIEVLKVATTVAPADVAVPAGFKEDK